MKEQGTEIGIDVITKDGKKLHEILAGGGSKKAKEKAKAAQKNFWGGERTETTLRPTLTQKILKIINMRSKIIINQNKYYYGYVCGLVFCYG